MSAYCTVYEIASKWGVTPQYVSLLCRTNRIIGSIKQNGIWLIPSTTQKPLDNRKKVCEDVQDKCFRYIDLFAGIGGFRQGIERVAKSQKFKTECVFAADSDPAVAKIYKKNYGTECFFDLTKIETHKLIDEAIGNKELTCLFGGFPCQPFSKAGAQEGFLDQTKGTLFFEIVKIIHRYKPRFIILENVRNLKNHDGGNTWKVIKKSLICEGYVVDDVIISPNNIAPIPALRERFFILAYNKRKNNGYKRFAPINKKYSIIQTSIYSEGGEKGELNQKFFLKTERNHIEKHNEDTINMWDDLVQMLRQENRSIISPLWPHYFDPGIDLSDVPDWKVKLIKRNQNFYEQNRDVYDLWYKKHKDHFDSLCKSDQKFEWNVGNEIKSAWEGIIQFRPSGVRVKRPDFIPTLVTVNQTPIIGCQRRYLCPEEMAKLYGFRNLKLGKQCDTDCRKQLGNTVSVDVVEYLIKHVLKVSGWR